MSTDISRLRRRAKARHLRAAIQNALADYRVVVDPSELRSPTPDSDARIDDFVTRHGLRDARFVRCGGSDSCPCTAHLARR